ncbi:MAG: IS30 family transposase [Anaerolineaceae bacterium]|nr:IS30 family transposase [Anaerolineaceae bacterium]
MITYKQLTREQRYQIYALLKTKNSMTKIAEVIGVHKSTVSREISRNMSKRGYRPKKAHEMALEKRRKAKPRISTGTWALVEDMIRKDFSPEQVSGRLYIAYGIKIRHEWIYQYILSDKIKGGDLYRHSRCQKKRRKRYGSYNRRGKIHNRTGIEERPGVINDHLRVGDWEVDTLFGKGHKHVIVTLTERKSRMTLVSKVVRITAQAVCDAVVNLLTPLKDRTYSLTSDNGKEFSLHQEISSHLDIDFYFARPYAAWERGTNENMNGLLRQYFPKKRDLKTITNKEIQHAMNKLNNRPRKCLDFKTPIEVFFNQPVALKS